MSSAAATLEAFINRVGGVATSFSIELPDGKRRNIGNGNPEFHVSLRNERALKALRTLDEANVLACAGQYSAYRWGSCAQSEPNFSMK